MASDIYSMLTGGYDPRAEQMKQQQAFQQQLSQATNPQSFIATVGSNFGGMLGQGIQKIAGGEPKEAKIRRILDQVSSFADPLKQAQEAYKLFSQEGMQKEAQMMMERIRTLQEEKVSQDYRKAQTDYYSRRGNGEAAGTGPERMIAKIGDVRRRLLQGEDVPEWEIAEAQDAIEYLGKQKSYTDSSGRIVTVSQAQLTPLPTKKGAAQAGSEGATTSPVTGDAGAPRVTLTPEYKEGLKRFSDSRVKALDDFQTGLDRLNRIIANKDDFTTRGVIGGIASVVPGTDAYAQRSDLKTLVARTVTETLSDLKAQSKTGATGFGALSAPDLEIIQTAITDLDVMSPTFDKNLLELKKRWEKAVEKLKQAEADYQASQGIQPATTAPDAPKKERKPLASFKRG